MNKVWLIDQAAFKAACSHLKTVSRHFPAQMEDGIYFHAIDEVVCTECNKSWHPVEADCPRNSKTEGTSNE